MTRCCIFSFFIFVGGVCALSIGCRHTSSGLLRETGSTISDGCIVEQVPAQRGIDYPAPGISDAPVAQPFAYAVIDDDVPPPLSSATELPEDVWPLTLDRAITLAFEDTKILRELGARLLANPQLATTVFDPAIKSTDPVFGVEAALSQFDARLASSMRYSKNDNVFNNQILGGGANEIKQDLVVGDLSLGKTSAAGTRFLLRTSYQHDNNNSPNNLFDHSWTTFWEAQIRQPLLQGRGVQFNRIAGPEGRPGFFSSNGVLISRIDEDISIAQFELGVRDFVNDIVHAYWELYVAYQDFDAAKSARDASLETWNVVKSRFDNDLAGGEADKEAAAREHYFLFQSLVVAALNGDPRSGAIGILQAESNLRRLLGLPQSDGRIIRPTDRPVTAKTIYDWSSLVDVALNSRPELRQQSWRVKQSELKLLASRNFTLPRLDAVATYRNNGFGDDLIGGGSGRFASAFKDSISGDHDEWEFGFFYDVPIGFRKGWSGVRNYQLQLSRQRAILAEQKRQILFDLGSSIRQSEQYYAQAEYAYNRLRAANDTVQSRTAAFEADGISLDQLLESQRRAAEAAVAFTRAQVNFELAGQAVKFQSGSLLSSHAVFLDQATSLNCALTPVEQRRRKLQQVIDYRLKRD